MRAITVLQPFATAIARYGKRVENRGWRPPAAVVGETLAIHAGKKWMPPGDTYPQSTLPALGDPAVYPTSAVLAVARLAAVCTASFFGERCDCGPWAVDGECHWWLADVRALPDPVPCKGRQKLWTLPPEVAEKVIAQLDEEASR
ncbi:MAG TPA: hypothetical protein VGW74_01020 [Propionibacteriaceae bacterium]|nr:hypothetical protein [Propionibacteriaceae bacterium]